MSSEKHKVVRAFFMSLKALKPHAIYSFNLAAIEHSPKEMMIEFETYQQSGHSNRSSGFLGSALVFQAYGLHSLLHWNHSGAQFFPSGHLDGILELGQNRRGKLLVVEDLALNTGGRQEGSSASLCFD